MESKTKKTLSLILRTAVCIGAMYLVLRNVSMQDRGTLASDGSVVVLENWADAMSLLDQGTAHAHINLRVAGSDQPITLADLAKSDDNHPLVDVGLATAWRTSNKQLILLAILVYAPVMLIQSVRFTWMVRAQEIELSFWEGIKLTYAGNFLNFVALGSTGGDIFKAYYVSTHTDRKTEAVTTVFLDRAVGLISLLILCTLAMTLKLDDPSIRESWPIIAMLSGGLTLGIVVFFSQRLRKLIRFEALLERLPFADQVKRIDATTLRMRHHKPLLIAALLLTLALQALAISAITVAGKGLGMHVTWSLFPAYVFYLSLAMLVAAIPISYQGVGTMDGILQIFFLGTYGSYSQILFLGFAMRLLQLLWSLPGFLVPITGAHRPSSAKIEQLQSMTAPAES